MADVKSDEVIAGSRPDSGSPAGVTLTTISSYTIPASDAPGAGDKAEMVPVPKGAKILEVVLSSTGSTSGLTIDVGDDSDVDRYLDGVDGSAAVLASLTEDGVAATGAHGHEYSASDTIDITFLGAAPTAADVYTLAVTWCM